MGLISTPITMITPEVTAFHEVDSSISMLFANTAATFLKAGTPLTAASGTLAIMAMAEPKGVVTNLTLSTDLPTALLAHDVDYKTANEEISVGVVTRGVYYSANVPTMLDEQIASLKENGLLPYGVVTK